MCTNDYGLLNTMVAIPTYGKVIKNLFLQNQVSFNAESLCIALETKGLPRVFKWWSFNSKVKIVPNSFVWGICWKIIFSKIMKDLLLKLET